MAIQCVSLSLPHLPSFCCSCWFVLWQCSQDPLHGAQRDRDQSPAQAVNCSQIGWADKQEQNDICYFHFAVRTQGQWHRRHPESHWQTQELSPELVGTGRLCWTKESSVSSGTAPASPVYGCYSLLALPGAPGLAGGQICWRSAAARGSSRHLPATSGSSLKFPQPRPRQVRTGICPRAAAGLVLWKSSFCMSRAAAGSPTSSWKAWVCLQFLARSR